MDEQALEAARHLSISAVFGRIPDFYVATELYEPLLKAKELAEDRSTRDEQLRREGERVRRHMMRMLETLKTGGIRGAGTP